jgi:SAM-dependent methyltransferase
MAGPSFVMGGDDTYDMTRATDWDLYYSKSPAASRFTRPIIENTFIRAFGRYSVPHPIVAELGGAGSRVLPAVIRHIAPSEYHIVDSNEFGLNLLRNQPKLESVFLHHQNVLNLELPLQVDTVFSLGLIEHFDEDGTKRAILAHFRILKQGGIAIISFPTPTFLYRATRTVAEWSGKWIFHDERPLWTSEIQKAIDGQGRILMETLIWPIFLTQTLLVIKKT